eukprot:TRINITY_DN29857_c0_g1_i1.p1 TRINITY_DN29857_c0_g1~~TRINITY_DN29857_c0_g1_i1.p1  ORF type:complete len:307 (+),score=56.58 TRINITY_DN29857_c0_g1_i1:32-922(+)
MYSFPPTAGFPQQMGFNPQMQMNQWGPFTGQQGAPQQWGSYPQAPTANSTGNDWGQQQIMLQLQQQMALQQQQQNLLPGFNPTALTPSTRPSAATAGTTDSAEAAPDRAPQYNEIEEAKFMAPATPQKATEGTILEKLNGKWNGDSCAVTSPGSISPLVSSTKVEVTNNKVMIRRTLTEKEGLTKKTFFCFTPKGNGTTWVADTSAEGFPFDKDTVVSFDAVKSASNITIYGQQNNKLVMLDTYTINFRGDTKEEELVYVSQQFDSNSAPNVIMSTESRVPVDAPSPKSPETPSEF